MKMQKKRGFTLVEVLLATAISVMVFAAMGALLTRSFTLWMNAMANWKLAQHARVARARLLDGGFGSGTGWLSSTNVIVASASGEAYVQYYPLKSSGAFYSYGWTNSAAGKDIRLRSGSSVWAVGQNVAATNYVGDVDVEMFRLTAVTNQIITATYQLRLSVMGKTFTQPCTVKAYLIN
ncbi:MAG: type II secretion system protein [Kiritimatiellaceae bacterium]|nr:type II secretion system protein [Kiritimatiellaceae bacterium]